ncbi:MAG: TolB protein [Thermomicrobiales bacterium]|nr:TolB protein [Thermomicrobiales bacterium]
MPALLCVVLAACADDGAGPRFANEPPSTEDAVLTATTPRETPPTATPNLPDASPVPLAQLLAAPGGVSKIVLQVGDDLIAISPPWSQPRPIWSGSNDRLVAFGASPTGDAVALLIAGGDGEDRIDLVLISPDGAQMRRVENLERITGGAATSRAPDGASSLSWSPDGTQVLASLATGGILTIPRSGDPQLLIGPSRAAAPGDVAWSPRGDAIAYIDPAVPDAAGGLYVAQTGAVPLDPVPVIPPAADRRRTVSRVAWTLDGEALLYTVASTAGDPTFGGDLFRISAAGGTPRLVAGASRVGPVSAITNFAPSPDGTGVAYVVTMPDESGNPTDSLWLQPIGSNETERLPLGAGERVTGLWWTVDGLLWSAAPTGNGDAELILYRAKAGESPGVVYRGPAAPATPEASQDASPVAASPAAD